MKVSMSLTVEESEEGLCFSSRIRYQKNAEITKSKMISCPDIDDYLAPYKQPTMTWYKVQTHLSHSMMMMLWFLSLLLALNLKSLVQSR